MERMRPLVALLFSIICFYALTFTNWPVIGNSTYPLPPPSSQELVDSYPVEVREALKHVIGITTRFSQRNIINPFLGQEARASGTGFMTEPGIFVSARHVLMALMENYIRMGHTFLFNKYGVPTSTIFEYSILGVSDIGNQSRDINLALIGLGAEGKFEDFMVLKASDYPQELKPLETIAETLKINDIVYNAGYVVIHIPIGNENVELDIIRESFIGRVDAIITDLSINKTGASVIYRIEAKFESGFSGGPILNSQGKVVGMTVLRSGRNNYLYAIPIRDVTSFIDKLKKDGAIKK